MKARAITASLFSLLSVSISSFADETGNTAQQPGSSANTLFYTPFNRLSPSANPYETDMQSCDSDNTALVTIYSANGMARSSIDVKVDGNQVGSLKSYFPDGAPGCKSPSARGVITLKVNAGRHTLEATSPNLNWPVQNFSVQKCECMLVPLS